MPIKENCLVFFYFWLVPIFMIIPAVGIIYCAICPIIICCPILKGYTFFLCLFLAICKELSRGDVSSLRFHIFTHFVPFRPGPGDGWIFLWFYYSMFKTYLKPFSKRIFIFMKIEIQLVVTTKRVYDINRNINRGSICGMMTKPQAR